MATEEKKQQLKGMIERLHAGEDPEAIKGEFRELLNEITAADISEIEEELVKEGLPREKLLSLCDIHIALFKESLEKEEPIAPEGHPVHILMEEHKMVLDFVGELVATSDMLQGKSLETAREEMEHVDHIIKHLLESESHYVREENVLFPYLEKHGIKEPPAVMWMEHDKIREMEKTLNALFEGREAMDFQEFASKLGEQARTLKDQLTNHFYKENNILYPTGLQVIPEDEWTEIRRQFDELGYCCFTPQPSSEPSEHADVQAPATKGEGVVSFETGTLSAEELESILNTLPVDLSFVDKDDNVKYFSQPEERLFPRAKAIIGRSVQNCHPEKSVGVVNKILSDFREGKRSSAEFWFEMGGKFIHIRYFAIRSPAGEYLGCLEVSQNVTDIRKLEGKKTLLD